MSKSKYTEASPRVTNREKVLAAFKDAGPGVPLSGKDVEQRTGGVKNVYEYLSAFAQRGMLTRVSQGIYALPFSAQPIEAEGSIDETMADDIRAEERRRIAGELAAAVRDAVPQSAMEYIQGFQDGANFIAERVLGMVLEIDLKTPF